MKKIIAVLFMLILTTVFILNITSCGDKNIQNDTTDDITANNNSPANESSDEGGNISNPADGKYDRFAIKEDIPELDFGGRTFTFFAPYHGMYIDYYFTQEEDTGDKMNDVLWKRQRNVEDRFNITINPIIKGAWDSTFGTVSRAVKAGDDAYQLAMTHNAAGVYTLSADGYIRDWNTIPYVDFSKPWWTKLMNDKMTIDGILTVATSDFVLFDPLVIFFNKGMAQNLDLGNIYQLVKDGKWTWTKLTELAKVASKDLDGDGKFTKEDQYGLVTHVGWRLIAAQYACDMYNTTMGDQGYPVYALKNEKYGSLLETLYDLLYSGNQTFIGDWNDSYAQEAPISMGTDRVLFLIDALCVAQRYRAYDVEFGILPYPKYDDAQEGYFSYSQTGFMVIPNTADPEFVGAVSEALAAESHRLTVPAYYDVVLTSKVARDEESVDMLDIIFNGATTDFGQCFGNWNALVEAMPNILAKKSTDYVSFIEKYEESFNLQMRNAYDKVRENYGK